MYTDVSFPDEKFVYFNDLNLYQQLEAHSDESKLKEYFIIVMGDMIKENEVKIEPLESKSMFLATVGNSECYVIIEDRILKCHSFYSLKSKYLQNCIATLNNLIDLSINDF